MLSQLYSKVESVLAASDTAEAYLARSGDKCFVFSESEKCFIMYREIYGFFVALGDPVGEVDEWGSVICNFIELSNRNGSIPVFYKVEESAEFLQEQGFTVEKVGEDAVLELDEYSLAGKRKSNLRRKINQAIKQRVECSVIESSQTRDLFLDLESISEAWLLEKNGSERGFSVGAFSREYFKTQKVGLAVQDNKIMAFCTINETSIGNEAAIDLMRHDDMAPIGSMHSLVDTIIKDYKRRGFEKFSLCMAPLSGLNSESKTIVNRTLNRIYSELNHLHGFQGLRQFKEYYKPSWEPKYLAANMDVVSMMRAIKTLTTAMRARNTISDLNVTDRV